MKMKSIIVLIVITVALGPIKAQEKLPSFKWDVEQHKKSKGQEEFLWITFPDGGPKDVAILKRINPIPDEDEEEQGVDDCIFSGSLKNESNVMVSLNGCPLAKTFEVCIID